MSCNSYDPLTKPTIEELIVAKPDRTAPARASVPSDDFPTNPLGQPFFLGEAADEPQQRRQAQISGIAIAIHTVTCLLANSDAFRDTQTQGMPTEPGHWPLSATHTEGLFAAIYFLSQYAESLSNKLVTKG
jgi:hypothetical protein